MTTEQTATDAQLPDASGAAAPVQAKPRLDPRAMLKRLQAESPTFRDYKPLALKIDGAILERFPDFDRKNLRTALRLHTASTKYLKGVERGTHRHDLDGAPVGELSDEHRQHAAATLKDRFAEVARQQREKRAAEEAERRHAQKLQQLVHKFGR
ncbi:MAG: ProQ/FinO family protein [Rhodocyclaceae bacterium]|jgi:ProP effector